MAAELMRSNVALTSSIQIQDAPRLDA